MTETRWSLKLLTKTCHAFHDISADLRVDSVKRLCWKCREGRFMWVEVSGCLHPLRLVRATSACLLVRQGSVVSPDTAEGWEAKYCCNIFHRSLKASSCCPWPLSCAVMIVVRNDVPKALQVPRMRCVLPKSHYGWNSCSTYYTW